MKSLIFKIGVAFGFAACISVPNFITDTVEVKVSDKEVMRNSNSTSYMVYTDKTTYTLNDSIVDFNFDSSDDYGKLKVDNCYSLYVRGIRFPLFSMYQNIGSYSEIACK